MSQLLNDLIQQSRADAAAYEAFLRRAEELVQRIAHKGAGDHPAVLNDRPEAVVLYMLGSSALGHFYLFDFYIFIGTSASGPKSFWKELSGSSVTGL